MSLQLSGRVKPEERVEDKPNSLEAQVLGDVPGPDLTCSAQEQADRHYRVPTGAQLEGGEVPRRRATQVTEMSKVYPAGVQFHRKLIWRQLNRARDPRLEEFVPHMPIGKGADEALRPRFKQPRRHPYPCCQP
jgi:hypothetical protein